MKEISLLGAVYSVGLANGRATASSISNRLQCDERRVQTAISRLIVKGLLARRGPSVSLTKQGRKKVRVVFIGGGFEIIHPGHIETIRQARELGDVLVVVVAKDSTIRIGKGREPVSTEPERVGMLSSLRQVDAAILGVTGNIYDSLERVRPDIVALGYDQHHSEADILREGKKRGMSLTVVRLETNRPGVKTSKILRET